MEEYQEEEDTGELVEHSQPLDAENFPVLYLTWALS